MSASRSRPARQEPAIVQGGVGGADPVAPSDRGSEWHGLFEAIAARSDDALAVSAMQPGGRDIHIVWVNETFTRLTGFTLDDVYGQSPATLLSSENALETVSRIDHAVKRGADITEKLSLRRKQGPPIEVTSQFFVHHSIEFDGRETHYLVARCRDPASDQRTDIRWISEEWAQAIVQGISDVIVVTDDDAKITWVSPSVTDQLGYDPASLIGQNCFDLIHPDDLDLAAIEWVEVVTTGSKFNPTEYRIRAADGTYRKLNVVANPQFDHPAIGGMILTASDITERAQAEEQLRRSEQWAQSLVQGGSDLVLVADANGTIKYASPSVSELLGYEPHEFVGHNQLELLHPDDRDDLISAFRSMRSESPDRGPFEFRVRHRDGTWKILSVMFSDMLDNPVVEGIVVNVRDVTSRRQAEDLLAEQADLLEAIARGAPLEITLQKITQMIEHSIEGARCAVGMLDTDGAIRVRAAPNLPRAVITLLDELSPRSDPSRDLRAGEGFQEFDLVSDERFNKIEVFADHGLRVCRAAPLFAPGSGELLGSLTVFFTNPRPLEPIELDLLGRAMNLAAIAIERRRFESTLEYQALYDGLTGLPNRSLLHSRIRDALDRAARLKTGIAVLFVDIDRFKVINDSVGHALGDQLLQLVAERLRGPLRPGDTLGRFGGDEFMIVCNRIPDEEAASEAARKFASVLTEPFRLGGGEIHVTVSIGIAFTTDPTEEPESLVRNADVAMYRAKDQGRNQYVVFQENLDRLKVEQLALEQALRAAIDSGEFELHFQPVVDLRDGAMAHAEALVRWHRPGHGLVMPGTFIPLAEETGLIVPLGWWVLQQACEEAARWPVLPNGRRVQIAVNLSARQLASPDLIHVVQTALERTGVSPDRLCFEITESDLVHDVEHAVNALNRLKALGVKIAIDDFGTGYASLDYIRHFTMADYLKIDRSFVDGVEKEGSQEAAIVSAAISMAKSLGLQVVAEGVETLFQMEALRDLDCDLAQGYLFSKPVPVDDAIELMLAQG